ncbi:MAG: hypothetical protein V1679_03190, partial [Candidatus Peregrinibacteria bacterium]
DMLTNLRDGANQTIKDVLRLAVASAKTLRIIDRINVHTLPKLLKDDKEDELLKNDIIDHLNSKISARAPLYEEIEMVANECFDKEVRPENLIKFFESDKILLMLVDSVLNMEHSRYRASNALAAVSSTLQSAALKINTVINRKKKKPVTPEIKEKLELFFDNFKYKYDPRDPQYTVQAFMQRIKEKFAEYDVVSWIIKNKRKFVALVKGYDVDDLLEIESEKNSHIESIVEEAYLKKGKKFPGKFIAIYSDKLFKITPSKMGDSADEEVLITINTAELNKFFNKSISKIEDRERGAKFYQQLIIEECIKRTIGHREVLRKIYKMGKDNEGNPKSEFIECEKEKEVAETIRKIIEENPRISISHIDVTNLLANPTETPQEIKDNYKEFFNERGEPTKAYEDILRSLFGIKREEDETKRSEDLRSTKARVKHIFKEVDMILQKAHSDLNMPTPQTFDSIKNETEYGELVKIACTSGNPQERFAARRKLQLASLVYSCMYDRRWVYKKEDAQQIKERLESVTEGIKIEHDKQLEEIHFIDRRNGKVEIVSDPSKELKEGGNLRTETLIPAKFGGVKCHLLSPRGDTEYMSLKSLFSYVLKIIHKEKTRAKDVVDIIRMTFVADSMEDLQKIQKQIETHYISFGRALKIENLYGAPLKRKGVNLNANRHKSKEYKTLRYVVDVPIFDKAGNEIYLATIEIRAFLKEDLARERSHYNDASHQMMEKRRLRTCMETLTPKEIYPEFYEVRGFDPDDIFGRYEIALKEEFSQPTEEPSSQTSPTSSPPASS